MHGASRERLRSRAARVKAQPAALWTLAFRPFFLAASLWSAFALALWIVMLFTGQTLPSRFGPLEWHIHEMLFGFVPAAIAGFMLTAIPTWTGRSALHGAPLACLAALWLLGRIACSWSALMPLWLAAAVDLAFPFALCAVAACEIIAARSWRNLPMPLPIAVLGVADVLMYLEAAGRAVSAGLGWRLGLAAIIILVTAVAGRIIPSFTHNWLSRRGVESARSGRGMISRRGTFDRLGMAALHAGLLGWAFEPASRPFGVLLVGAAVLALYRLVRWRGLATLAEPLLAVLHLGYGWVVIGAALLGASMLGTAVPLAAAVHAFTAGAIGTLVLAVMTRVSLGHTGRPLQAGRATTLIYVMVSVAAAARVVAGVVASVSAEGFLALIVLSGALWVASFALFAARYGPLLVAPRAEQGRDAAAVRAST